MTRRDRDVAAFGQRAHGYEAGWLGRFHQEIADRVAALAVANVSAPQRVLDVGCGTGYLLRQLADRYPQAVELAGIDAAAAMVEVAREAAAGSRLSFVTGAAERLPYPDATFDLVVSTTSFDHWTDQQAGLAECARVMVPDGCLVLVDLFSPWLLPTLLMGRQGRARTRPRATRLLTTAGFRGPEWYRLNPLIQAVTATVQSRR